MQMKYEDQIEKIQNDHKEELEKLRKKIETLKTNNSTETCSLLMENYKKIHDQNCDLTLELAGGKTLGVHKTILMGNL